MRNDNSFNRFNLVLAACAVAALAAAAFLTAACGAGQDKIAKDIEDAIEDVYKALEERDDGDLEDLVTGDLADELEEAQDDETLDDFWAEYGGAELDEVEDIEISGTGAEAVAILEVGEQRFEQDVELELDGTDWKVSDLGRRSEAEEAEDDEDEDRPSGRSGAGSPAETLVSLHRAIHDRDQEAITGIITGRLSEDMSAALDRAKVTTSMADVEIIGKSVEQYKMDNMGRVPDADSIQELLGILRTEEILSIDFSGQDGWGNDLIYQHDGQRDYTVISYGSDGAPGPAPATEGETRRPEEDIIWNRGVFTQRPGGAGVRVDTAMSSFAGAHFVTVLETEVDGDTATVTALLRDAGNENRSSWRAGLQREGGRWKVAEMRDLGAFMGNIQVGSEQDIRDRVEQFMRFTKDFDYEGIIPIATGRTLEQMENMREYAGNPDFEANLDRMREQFSSLTWEIQRVEMGRLGDSAEVYVRVESENFSGPSKILLYVVYDEWLIEGTESVPEEQP